MKRVKLVTKEWCTCQFEELNGVHMQKPNYQGLKFMPRSDKFRCLFCNRKFPLNSSPRKCSKCGGINRQHFLDKAGNYYYYCPACYLPVRKLVDNSNIPPLFAKSLNELDEDEFDKDCLTDFRAIVADPSLLSKGSILLTGRTGCGKTTLSCSLGFDLMRCQMIPVKYVHMNRYLNRLKTLWQQENSGAWNPSLQLELYSLLRIEQSPVLIIDDLIKPFREGFESGKVYDMIDYRYGNKMPTIFTTYCRSLEGILPEHLATRIMQMAQEYCLGDINRRTP